MGAFDFFSVSRESPLNQGMNGKKGSKAANEPVKQKISEKKTVFITSAATGTVDGTTPSFLINNYAADFYRNGKFNDPSSLKPVQSPEGGQSYVTNSSTYEILPRTFQPFDQDIPASIRIWGKPKKAKEFSYLLPAYTKFFLETVQESHAERSQIIETFGDFYVFMFGERPPIYNFSGQLVNSVNANWVTDFMFMYDRYFRGTRCVEQNATAVVVYGGRQVDGLLLTASTNTNSTIEGAVGFTFSMVVFDRKFYSFSEDMGLTNSTVFGRTTGGALGQTLYEDSGFKQLLDQISGKTGQGSATAENSKAFGIGKSCMDGGAAQGLA